MLRPDDQEWLEKHEAQVWFSAGRKIGLELTRADGLRVQCSDWTWPALMMTARQLLNRSELPNGSLTKGHER